MQEKLRAETVMKQLSEVIASGYTQIVDALKKIMKLSDHRNMEDMRNSTVLQSLSCASEVWTWNVAY